jgi:ammonia channel protein AmtB
MEKVDAWSKKYSDQVNTREGGPYSPSLVILGVLFLWVGDLCFNGGANLKIVGKEMSEQA